MIYHIRFYIIVTRSMRSLRLREDCHGGGVARHETCSQRGILGESYDPAGTLARAAWFAQVHHTWFTWPRKHLGDVVSQATNKAKAIVHQGQEAVEGIKDCQMLPVQPSQPVDVRDWVKP